jgi:hypothetical protein
MPSCGAPPAKWRCHCNDIGDYGCDHAGPAVLNKWWEGHEHGAPATDVREGMK